VQIFGPASGALQDDGERLAVEAPDTPNTNAVPYVTMEEVRYNDKAPWPAAADGSGASLQRRSAFAFGNEPTNWVAAAPTPGRFSADADSDGDGLPDSWEAEHGTNWKLPDGDADPDHDGIKNLWEFQLGTDPQIAQDTLQLGIGPVPDDPNSIALSFIQLPGRSYTVEMTTELMLAAWSNWFELTGATNASVVRIPNSVPSDSSQFFRLHVQNP
jgi:hypothetical protein